MTSRRLLLVGCLAQLGFAWDARAASSLDELLQQVKNARAEEQKLTAEREKEFVAHRDQRAVMLKDALAKRDALEKKSKELSSRYDSNDKEINQLNQLLMQREGNLGELFGVTRQVAGDVATVLGASLVSSQYPGREEFLLKIAGSKALPSISELERIWFEMTREMTESGRVVRFEADVASPDGSSKKAEAVRVGPFIAESGGHYVLYQAGTKQLSKLSRQPSGELAGAAHHLDAATSGYVMAGMDPSRGVLLALSVERPTVLERIQKGELVGYIIISVGIVGALLALFQFLYLLLTRRRVARQLKNLDKPTPDNPIGRVLLSYKGDGKDIDEDAEIIELRISEAVLREEPKLVRFQAFLRLAVAAGPLLGLIGTVVGMIITFQSITESGSSDPKLMAAGIGQAMICTVLGLGIAIPLLFINAGLTTMSGGILQVIDEQSTGLLAESIEKRQSA
jgi:biopolymer transport protein ExbB